MSPIYAYVCSCEAVTEKIRTFAHRLDPVKCPRCGEVMEYRISAHHQAVDGIYSHTPNVGRPELVEKEQARQRGERWETLA